MSTFIFTSSLLLTVIVGSFVDRDMMMRYFGGGVGHLGNSPEHATSLADGDLEDDEEIMDDGAEVHSDGRGRGGEETTMPNVNMEIDGKEREEDSDSDKGSDLEGEDEDEDEMDSDNSEDDGYGSF